ncbi:hypothetical protein C8J57DRAFT_1256485 [Mycena rebaudengoi]|nr:hypothetical protein C8J57DRAFT_1256485 [Mycena rebaudengoi]
MSRHKSGRVMTAQFWESLEVQGEKTTGLPSLKPDGVTQRVESPTGWMKTLATVAARAPSTDALAAPANQAAKATSEAVLNCRISNQVKNSGELWTKVGATEREESSSEDGNASDYSYTAQDDD